MSKKEGKGRYSTKKRTTGERKRTVLKDTTPAISKEILGISLMGIGVLILIGIFSDKSGLFGSFLKQVFIGLFGVGGYIIPVATMIIGIFYIQGRFDRVVKLAVYLGSLLFMLIIFFHLLYYGEDKSLSLLSISYLEKASWQNGGYIGAVLSYLFLSLIGLYGTYVILTVLLGVWILVLTQFPVFSWINERFVAYINAHKEKMKATKENNKKKSKASKKLSKPMSETPSMQDEEVTLIASEPHRLDEIPIYDSSVYSENTTRIEDTEETKEDEPIKAASKVAINEGTVIEETMAELTKENTVPIPPYQFPPITLLQKGQAIQNKEASKKSLSNARKLEETLGSFGVEAKVTQIHKGPSVTRYELQPKQGVKVSKIVNLADDIALNLAAPNIRIEAPIPGKAAVGIEVANTTSEMVYLREVIDSDRFLAFPSKLAFALGKDIAGKPIIADIGKMPHILIAGATGSGKSVCINTLITSIIYKAKPHEVKLIMIDPKVVELSVYNGIPHLLIPVVTDPKKAAGALFWAVNEMTKRYNLFAENNVRDMKGYNEKQIEESAKLPQIVIIIDELADLMMTGAKEVEDAICRLAQMARAAGIHLVIATQRPSVDVITGVIKANIPSRLAFAVSSGTDSRTILDMVGAEKLLGKGDMLFYPVGQSKPIRIQGAFISDQEVESIVNAIKTDHVVYEEEVIQTLENAAMPIAADDEEEDELLEKAIAFAAEKEKLSISMLQRYFRIGFNRAARLMEALEVRGIVGPDEGSKPRKVL
ncbi:FtsK/SpoIIIE family DNA translocase [Cellulosilyticum lentocellum]|uniref:Cell division protein FtsK/SpoIIIE n=1 Tax=Cellulosilyticum lentocellum (strain ATCC 49066 / DSM 5427 / NCIMB 11756 / RHM5) TaxID=642492 RepID=F2JR12_CELLD|nr:DNA translocase FtsK [Cellulosilyticum lentocellum]ADZ83870.1 cell division protein FtsK/SpoIIIE [Cellulosilyticum lentocellum DSM 5427]